MKSNLDKFFKTDAKHAEDGVEFVIDEKTAFKVRHFNQTNPRIKAAMAQHYKPYAKQVELGTLGLDKQMEINVKVFIDVCLVSWRGVEIDGKEADCTPENAHKLFLDLPNLFDALWKHANDFQHYKEDVGNS